MNTKFLSALLTAGMLVLTACEDEFTFPNPNNPELEDFQQNPTRALVLDATQGLMIGARNGISPQAGYIAHLGVLGRESLTIDNSDPRFVNEMLAGDLQPGNNAFGGSNWQLRYRNLRNASLVLNALENPDLTEQELSTTEREAIRGFAKTLQALDLLLVINTRDVNGAVIDVDVPVGEITGPLVSRELVFAEINRLLDEAAGNLQNAGGNFPFRLSAGFSGFDTPLTFLEFNRALRARVAVYLEDYPIALGALDNSFLSRAAPLDAGVFYVFGTGGGDTQNGIAASPNIFANPTIRNAAQLKPDGTLDDRIAAKTELRENPLSRQGITTNLNQTRYVNLADPIPIIRNEELLLLRSEARWFTGDRAGAIDDLNFIRTESGGLVPITVPANDEAFVTALLRERLTSLYLEGHRWIDMRRFERLDELPLLRPTHTVPERFPIPRDECLARDLPVPCSA